MIVLEDLLHSFIIELRRGTLILSVLSQLHQPKYGYSLVQILEKKNATIEPGTLYPLLRRLEKQKILDSEWDTTESRPRKYYVLSEEGKEVYTRLKKEWKQLSQQISELIGEDEYIEID